MSPQTPERLRIARELHDGIAQDLVGLGYQLDLILADAELSEQTRSSVRSSRFHVDSLIGKVRAEILALRGNSHTPLHILLQVRAEEICSNLQISFDVEEVLLAEDEQREMLVIATEILRNVVAHSGATLVLIKLFSVDNQTVLEISDNGNGGAVMKENHWGLQGVSERVSALNGTLRIEEKSGIHISISI